LGGLVFNTTGSYNTSAGAYASSKNTTGAYNSALGSGALSNATTASFNTAAGGRALYNTTTGEYNSAFGGYALMSNITGFDNTAIGHYADVGSGDLNNATAIGTGAIVTASNTVQLGNASVTNILTSGSMTIGGSYLISSDRRLKKDIVDTRYGLNTILELRPVDYQMKSNNLEQIGFIAQELRPIVPEALSGIEGDLEKGETLSVAYTTLIPVLTKAIQEQQALIENQQQSIEAQYKVNQK
jgi:hypothetical protein